MDVIYNLSVALTIGTATTAKGDNAVQMLNDYEIVYNKETIEALQHADSVASQMVGLNIDDVPATFRSLSSETVAYTASFE